MSSTSRISLIQRDTGGISAMRQRKGRSLHDAIGLVYRHMHPRGPRVTTLSVWPLLYPASLGLASTPQCFSQMSSASDKDALATCASLSIANTSPYRSKCYHTRCSVHVSSRGRALNWRWHRRASTTACTTETPHKSGRPRADRLASWQPQIICGRSSQTRKGGSTDS